MEKIDKITLPLDKYIYVKPTKITKLNKKLELFDITVENDSSFVIDNGWVVHNSRYTSCKVSKFAKDVLYRDIEIIPMKDNYDQTLMEPEHFLPLVPLVLLNPSDGIAIGFASSILPRSLEDIINAQINELNGKSYEDAYPKFIPNDAEAINREIENNTVRWTFKGKAKKINSFEIHVAELPYGISHEKFISRLVKLEDDGKIKDFDDESTDRINITIKFNRGYLNSNSFDKVLTTLGLIIKTNENLNVIDLSGENVLTTNFKEIIKLFTNNRLQWYIKRYKRLLSLLEIDIQRYKDIILAIENDVGSLARTYKNKADLKIFLDEIGIVNLDYIADLPIYRFTLEEKEKIELKLVEALVIQKDYIDILSSEPRRIKIYISELKEILKNYKKGKYNG